MGEPKPGQIVDNIFLSIDQVPLADGQDLDKGEFVNRQGSGQYWEKCNGNEDVYLGFGQIRHDANTVGESDGDTNAEILIAPSYIYAIAGGNIQSGQYVELDTTGQKLVAAVSTDISAGHIVGKYIKRVGDTVAGPIGNNGIGIFKLGVN